MLKGYVKNNSGELLQHVKVELKDFNFETQIMRETDENGYFEFNEDTGVYPFLTAVKEYAENYLEFWALNVDLSMDHTFDIRIGKNEVYGSNVFCVSGAAYPLFLYFRPMSLKKFQDGDPDITPDITKDSVCVKLDGRKVDILSLQQVKEGISEDGATMNAYLVQLKPPRQNGALSV